MSNKIENPVVLIHKRENHDSYAVAITNGSHDFYDGLLMASVSPDEADNSFAVFAIRHTDQALLSSIAIRRWPGISHERTADSYYGEPIFL
ncbi:hypothetical protein FCX40_21825 [Escherichia coli]|nr:hypothetical protein [Escherichia coli]MDN0830215.1 hypothetical protein [Escherichia coli]